MLNYFPKRTWMYLAVAMALTVSAATYLAFRATSEDRIVVIAKQKISEGLLDPESAEFKIAQFGHVTKDRSFVCGTVNAKNSYGGYTGARPFVVTLDGEAPNEQPDTSKVAGQDWHVCEGCRDFDDYYADDSTRIEALCSFYATSTD
ncbi:MAG: hypothetical protein RB191_11090 [Terriglobia bacterium]|nr:hypothetical protein [Terriglobia bacterium]